MPKSKKYRFKVKTASAGSRLDVFLTANIPNLSREFLASQIKSGFAKINGQVVTTASTKLHANQFVEINLVLPSSELKSQAIDLDIIYRDKNMAVINKPAGMVMHPVGKLNSGTLANALKHKFGKFYLVHRLDKDTSGVVVVALNQTTKDYLSELFAKRQIKKTYLALVYGQLKPAEACIDLPIKRGAGGQFIADAVGRPAQSCYRVKEYLKHFSLVEVTPQTGRTHQIRVHLSALGHPVVADELYGKTEASLARQFLHAAKLEFVDLKGKQQIFSVPLPPDLANFLRDASN